MYTLLGAGLSFLATFYSCKSKVHLQKYGPVIRIIAVFAGWINTVLAPTVGVTMCSCHDVTKCQSFVSCNELLVTYYWRHCFCSVAGGVIYGSRLPERLLPGTFDIIGSSPSFSSHLWCSFHGVRVQNSRSCVGEPPGPEKWNFGAVTDWNIELGDIVPNHCSFCCKYCDSILVCEVDLQL